MGGEEAATERLGDGGGSGGAPVSSGRGCHGRRGQKPAGTRACQAPCEPNDQKKQAGGLALHRRRRIDGGGGNRGGGAVEIELGLVRVCVAEAKGEPRGA
jgi:hypothetical protein